MDAPDAGFAAEVDAVGELDGFRRVVVPVDDVVRDSRLCTSAGDAGWDDGVVLK